jgi:hypothetical protein
MLSVPSQNTSLPQQILNKNEPRPDHSKEKGDEWCH